jgi:GDSL-like lipase/acylhydrolase family protein
MNIENLKNLYVIGDNISIHYEPYLKDFITECYNYDRKGNSLERTVNSFVKNGGDSFMVLDYLKNLASEGFLTDVLMLNCGLHDIKVLGDSTEKRQVSTEDYKNNLVEIAEIAKKCAKETVWIRTTPINDEQHRKHSYSFQRFNADVNKYNEIADDVFGNAGMDVLDLYTFTAKLGKELFCDHIHFDESIRELQGAFIGGYLLSVYTR